MWKNLVAAAAFAAGCVTSNSDLAWSQGAQLESLGALNVEPPLPNLDDYVRNRQAAIVLGKALFWEQRIGSDNQACASCHFHAGVDSRVVNQLNPGLLDTRFRDDGGVIGDVEFGGLVNAPGLNSSDASPAGTAGKTASGQIADSNIELIEDDFPLHRLQDPFERNSDILYTTNDVVSSQGTFDGGFVSVGKAAPPHRDPGETCFEADASIFHAGPFFAARKVEPRNTPTTINAVFNFRNFWDGRANNIFNGENPFGFRDPAATILVREKNKVVPHFIGLENGSLASQASGPPLNDFEMSCAGKTFADLGRKVLKLQPLSLQKVHRQDSVLGAHVHPSGTGLSGKYGKYDNLVKDALVVSRGWWKLVEAA